MTTLPRAESDSPQAMVLRRVSDARRLVGIATDHLVHLPEPSRWRCRSLHG